LLKTENPKGQAFVQTAQLDGERTLKPKMAPVETNTHFTEIFGLANGKPYSKFEVKCVVPDKELYFFFGQIIFGDSGRQTDRKIINEEAGACENELKEDLDINQFLHRGALIRNSGRVLALVVYTGKDSKLVMNFGSYKFKRPQFERLLNIIIGIQCCLFLIMSGGLTLGNLIWNRDNFDIHHYIFQNGPSSKELTTKVFWSFWLMLNSMMPLEIEVAI
jgi:phospholipid-translocating ATPase